VAADTLLLFIGDGATAVVLFLFIRRGIYRSFPIFTCYLLEGILSDIAGSAANHYRPAQSYSVFAILLAVDSLFQFGVLVEVFWSVLRPVRSALPRWSLLVIAAILAGLGAIVWKLAAGLNLANLSPAGQLNIHVAWTFSIMRAFFFLALAGLSQLLAIGWRDRELQIATGFGFYSLVYLAVWLPHRTGPQYHILFQLVAVSYICSLVYWSVSFAQNETTRREFTPQMEGFLLAVAGTARSARRNLERPQPYERPERSEDERNR
jgi:hypothetical protein